MPTLLPDDDSVLAWFPTDFDSDEAFALIAHINRHAAAALAHPVSVEWLGQEIGTIHGMLVMVLGRPWAKVTFHIPQEKPVVGCCGLAHRGATIEWHGGDVPDTGRRLSSLGELIEILFSLNTARPSYAHWAADILADFWQELDQEATASGAPPVRPALAHLKRETSAAMECALPITTLRSNLSLQLVGDPALVTFLECLAEHRLVQESPLVRRLLDDHVDAAHLWRAVADSHERLAPLLLAALPHLKPVEAHASALLKHIGIGKGLSGRLRRLPTDQVPRLLEWADRCRHFEFTVAFFRYLAIALGQLEGAAPDDERFENQRLGFLFALSRKHAQLERWRAQGLQDLPQTALAALSLDLHTRPGSAAEFGRDGRRIGIHVLARVLEALRAAMSRATSTVELDLIGVGYAHVLDWLSSTERPPDALPQQVSLRWLRERADAWMADANLAAIPALGWPCALLSHDFDWRAIETAISPELKVVPLAETFLLVEESRQMRHCVAPAYWQAAARGRTRLFSIEQNGYKHATVELAFRRNWRCKQLKGTANLELIGNLDDPASPLGALVLALASFYSEKQPAPFASVL